MNIIYGDCLDIMKTINDDSIDLIMTSPPYPTSNSRPYHLGDIKHDDYVEWFLPHAIEIKRIMKPSGSFVLNIKERVKEGERLTYVLKLILALKESVGFRWVDEYIWHKSNPYPASRAEGFRDAWSRNLHFTKQKGIKIDKWAVAVPVAESTKHRRELGLKPKNKPSKSGAPFSKSPGWDYDICYPTNVIYGGVMNTPKGHPAPFPDYLPEFFIKAFTDPGDIVLDPFSGSHTTARVAESLDRIGIGIEIMSPKDD